MKKHRIIAALFMTSFLVMSITAQKKAEKLNERFSTNKDVTIHLDTRYADIEFESWNKNEVEISAYIEGENAEEAVATWDLTVVGNSKDITISGQRGQGGVRVYDRDELHNLEINLDEIIGQSLTVVEPVMEGLVGPLLEGLAGAPVPDVYYEEIGKMKFDHEAYRREGKAYLKRWEKQMDKRFGPEFEEAMEDWEKKAERNAASWAERLEGIAGIPKWPFTSNGSMTFDSDAYEKDKQAYVNRLNKKYGTSVTVREVDRWLEDMEAWGESFEKDMEKWGEKFEDSMEKWGEKFGKSVEKSMEAWGEDFGKSMEEWGENFGKQVEAWAEKHEAAWETRESRDADGTVKKGYSLRFETSDDDGKKNALRRVIKIKMPKKAVLDLNVRYGKVRMADVYNPKVKIMHGDFQALAIEGNATEIEVAYGPCTIGIFEGGSLSTTQVKSCNIASAGDIALTSKSSNVNIQQLNGAAMITGSFGKLTIPKIADTFGALTLVLENSDLALKLPDAPFNFNYSGSHNDLLIPSQLDTKTMNTGNSEMIQGYHKTRTSANVITITANYSDVFMN